MSAGSYGNAGRERGYYGGTGYGEQGHGYRERGEYGNMYHEQDYRGSSYDGGYGNEGYAGRNYGGSYAGGQSGQQGRGLWSQGSGSMSSWAGNDTRHQGQGRMETQQQSRFRGHGPKGYRRSDERITEDINDRLSDDGWLDASDIEVKVSNGEVVLTGTVDERMAKRRAEDITEAVSGVTNVENRIRIHHEDRQESAATSGTSLSGTSGRTSSGETGSNTVGERTKSKAA